MNNDLFLQHYENYFPKIYSFIFYRIRDKEIAEDLCSQTFLKAYEKIHQYHSDKGEFKTWLFQIARNSLIDHYRQNRHHQDLETAHQLKDERTDL